MILLLAIFLIVFKAVYDGLKTRGLHIPSAMVMWVFLAVNTLGLFAWATGNPFLWDVQFIPYWKVIIGFVLVRFALFDVIWNISAGMKLNYLGRTKFYDEFLGLVPRGFVWFVKIVIALPVGLTFLIKG
jgi:hypothetical protein